ncbi:MAG: pectate lyase [Paludibacteraceae bacterium]|nr:pectate lyase [Paludibacteraceae bacterium]MBR4704203.1 pectate lyase [Paludibacteraceae bacterium]
MKKILTLVLCTLSLCSLSAALLPDTIVAFPGAEGFGKYTSGGRGGKVVYVTSLADDANGTTEGTLRWAVQQYPGEPLTVCFAVSGEIRLVKDLRINRKNYTIAGQTAPGVGVVITHNKVNCGGSQNFIIRNIRFRIGRNDVKGDIVTQNAFGAENCSDYIIDHCEFGWSTEENMNTYDSHFITVQYCIVHEGLNSSGHPKGARGYGCQWGGSPASYHHNLLVNNNKRSCRFNGAQSNDYVVYLDYINNVNYNFEGGSNGCYGGENTANLAAGEYNGLNSAHECNFINNYYKKGPNTTNTKLFVSVEKARSGATSWGPSKWYFSGNVFDGVETATADNWSAVNIKGYTKEESRVDTLIRPATPWWRWTTDSVYGRYDFDMYAYAVSDYETAADAFETVLDTAGCFPRDHIGKRLVTDTRNGTYTYVGAKTGKKGIIDTEEDAEGFYDYTVVAPLLDTDLDGMPDEWEIANGCDPNTPDNNVRHASGYTMLEMYLDYAMTHKQPMDDGYQEPQGVENVQRNNIPCIKILRDGQLLIQRGDRIYTVTGLEVID